MPSDYFNPGSTRPAPMGLPGLDEMNNYYDRQMYQRFMDLQEHKNRALNNEYVADAPVREAARPAAIAKSGLATLLDKGRQAPKMVEATLAGERGDAQTRSAKGFVDQGTQETTRDSKNMKNIGDQIEMAADQLEAMGASNPALSQANWKQMRDGMPKQIQGRFPEVYSPEVPKLLKEFSTSVKNNIGQQRTMEAEGQKQTGANKRNQATVDAARYGHELRLEAAWARSGGKEVQKKVEGVVQQYLMMKMNGEKTTPQQDQVFQAAQQIMMNVRAAAGVASDPQSLGYQITQGTQPPPRPTPSPVAVGDPAAAIADVQKQVEAMGEKYEPDKWDYGINPNTGNFGKKPKAKK